MLVLRRVRVLAAHIDFSNFQLQYQRTRLLVIGLRLDTNGKTSLGLLIWSMYVNGASPLRSKAKGLYKKATEYLKMQLHITVTISMSMVPVSCCVSSLMYLHNMLQQVLAPATVSRLVRQERGGSAQAEERVRDLLVTISPTVPAGKVLILCGAHVWS